MTDELETQPGGEALPEAPEVDRRSAIAAALDKAETIEAPAEATDDRPRDEAGRFAPKEAPVEAQEPSEPKPQRKYPSSWKRELEPVYRRLEADPELAAVLDEVERREGDFHKGVEQYKSKAQFAEAMEKAISPYMATIQSMGASPDYAVQSLLAADHRLRYGTPTDKAQAMQQLAQFYGIDLGAVPQQAQTDPTIDALQRELYQLRHQVQQQFQQHEQVSEAQILSDIDAFKADKPHFETVRKAMAAMIQAGEAANLQEAYDKAVWAHPEIRTSLIEQQRKADEAKRKEEAQRAAAAAKSAAVQVRGAPTAGGGNPSVTDRRAMVEAAFSRSRI